MFKKFVAITFIFVVSFELPAKNVLTVTNLTNEQLVLDGNKELHLTASSNIFTNSSINLTSENAWLFFDQVKPSVVISSYQSNIKINSANLIPDVNARVCSYINGTVIVPHPAGFSPLIGYTEKNFAGTPVTFTTEVYYTDQPGAYVPASLKRPLGMANNAVRSFKLRRGYMATLADNPDGTGYSRVFIADTADLNFAELPNVLDQKVSFIRVFKWDWVSKKGWCGTTDVESQADLVDCTWFYTWGASSRTTYNLEFCPERWGPHWPGWDSINPRTGVSHLLGYNEPDHPEQSNASVDQAIADWPYALQTGLRLGSPATTDFNWLYQFLDKCQEKNYRVDFIVVHGYWGGMSPQEWYDKLNYLHQKTGKPIWIKEWNNGANWTHEAWPSTTAEQQQKQLNDLTGILNVMDTAHFMERYSIYNWVEDKRAMILNWSTSTKSGTLTPAGLFYKSNASQMAYNATNEVIPVWKIQESPVLSYNYKAQQQTIQLTWTDYNEEMNAYYIIERSSDNVTFTQIGRTTSAYSRSFEDRIPAVLLNGTIYYRLKSVGIDSAQVHSNIVKYTILNNQESIHADKLAVSSSDVTLNLFTNPWEETPVVIAGTPSNHNKFPLFASINKAEKNYFNFKLTAWNYQQSPMLTSCDTIAILTLPSGRVELGGIIALAGKLTGINTTWKRYRFTTPFTTGPVVFCNRVSARDSHPSIVRIKNCTSNGFDVALQYEEAITPDTVGEDLCFLALTPGTGRLNGKEIKVGLTEAGAVGSFFTSNTISFGEVFSDPLVFASMQTVNDSIASNLRIKKMTPASAEVFQEREISKTTTAVAKEQVGWMVIENGTPSAIHEPLASGFDTTLFFDEQNNRFVFNNVSGEAAASVTDLLGRKITFAQHLRDLSIPALKAGVYLLILNGCSCFKFVKQS
ncbi:MAG: glycosyl hydrolase [Bacteroidota bacterium]|nr:glycosyl hydrolase [Bacteroidota bacterium]